MVDVISNWGIKKGHFESPCHGFQFKWLRNVNHALTTHPHNSNRFSLKKDPQNPKDSKKSQYMFGSVRYRSCHEASSSSSGPFFLFGEKPNPSFFSTTYTHTHKHVVWRQLVTWIPKREKRRRSNQPEITKAIQSLIFEMVSPNLHRNVQKVPVDISNRMLVRSWTKESSSWHVWLKTTDDILKIIESILFLNRRGPPFNWRFHHLTSLYSLWSESVKWKKRYHGITINEWIPIPSE